MSTRHFSTGSVTFAASARTTSTPTSASPKTTAGTLNMSTDRTQEIRDLRALGYDTYTIARKLELTVPEVEKVIYGTDEATDDSLVFWASQHY